MVVHTNGMNFGTHTRDLLAKSNETYQQIAEKTGLSVRWLYKFAGDEHQQASLTHVQALHDYLAKRRRGRGRAA